MSPDSRLHTRLLLHELPPADLRRRAIHASFVAALAVAALLFLAGCSKPQPAPPPPEVTVAPVVNRQVAEWDEFTGHFEARQMVEVRARVSGFIQRVAFREGALVREGDPLFVIDPRPYDAEVARADAILEQARTQAQLATVELERAKRLVGTQAISREELDARTSGVAEASANVRAAEAALRTARLNLEWTTVRAPISGRVGRAQITVGNLVQAGPSVLTTLVSVDPIYVYFDTDEQAYLRYVRTFGSSASGTAARRPVQIALAGETGFPHEGTLDFVDNRVDPSAGTIRLRAVVSNGSGRFTPGLFARVRLASSAPHPAMLVQDQAIGTDQDRKFVLVLKGDSTVEYRPIQVGRLVDGLRVVDSGLTAGDHVVINGLLRVRPGMRVTAKQGTMLAAAPDQSTLSTSAAQ